MEILSSAVLAIGLGFLGFIEPCTMGSTAILFRRVERLDPGQRVSFGATYLLVRTILTGVLGMLAVVAGSYFVDFQRWMWAALGLAYIFVGVLYASGKASFVAAPFLQDTNGSRNAFALGVLFSLNIPACAAPLLALLIGSAAIGASSLASGFFLLAAFGLAISLPVVLGIAVPAIQRRIVSLSRWSARAPLVTGILLGLVGLWSVVLAFRLPSA